MNYSSQMITFSVAVGRNGKLFMMAVYVGVTDCVKSKRSSRCGIDTDKLKKRWFDHEFIIVFTILMMVSCAAISLFS